jgi:uncharacterized membrane protein
MGMTVKDGGSLHPQVLLERLTFFSDAVFAIAMTLLVIEVRLPHLHERSDQALGQALLNIYPNYVGFVVSFLVIGRFWVGHHRVMGMLAATSERLVWRNLFFLMAVAFMPFPTAVFSEYASLRVGVGVYTGWLVVLGIANRAVITTALGDPALVAEGIEDAVRRQQVRISWIPILIGGSAFAAGMVVPALSLLVLMVGSPLIGMGVRRWAARA